MANDIKDDQPGAEYAVGYGKPPKQHQFKPGQKANPLGRPKGSRSTQQEVRALLDGSMTVRSGGREKKMNRRKALIRALFERAANGNNRAAEILLKLDLGDGDRDAKRDHLNGVEFAPEDLEILRSAGLILDKEVDQ